jgi:hypothetical protein
MASGFFTLGGVVIGSVLTYLLTRRWQREQWFRDRRYDEFRELLTTVAEVFAAYPTYVFHAQSPEMQIGKSQLLAKCSTVLADRLFIAGDVKEMNLLTRWEAAMNDLQQTYDLNAWMREKEDLTEQIVKKAGTLS